ncbi:hypothetical protein SEUCBS140593_001977 [Sporothrix eucalyptigena]|uniref:Uncharacterized protein n=1 Tax=Sporothrix eucalyptigena TaxID=1812306 RepID=A0ABP0B2W6_9PEZI
MPIAQRVVEGEVILPVARPGSPGYTVIVNKGENIHFPTVIAFREGNLNDTTNFKARIIHTDMVSMASKAGEINDNYPPLRIYTMPVIPGTAFSDVQVGSYN